MDYSTSFARHFARLVWLLLHEETAVAEQKMALRALVTISKDGDVRFVTREWRLLTNDLPVPEALQGVPELMAQMIGHAMVELRIDRNVAPADLLGVARILAGQPRPGEGGREALAKLRSMDAQTVHAIVEGHSARPQGPAAVDAPVSEPAVRGARTVANTVPNDTPTSIARAVQPMPTTGTAIDGLFSRLDEARSVVAVTRQLDALVRLGDDVYREGRVHEVAAVVCGIVRRESGPTDSAVRRAYSVAVRRLFKPTLLRALASLLAGAGERHDEYLAVLGRASDDGAEAVIDQLSGAHSMSERRVYFDALVKLKAGVPALVQMLRDPRWYVARNAADLLGELQATSSEGELAALLKHDDDRVRRAAAGALAKLGTPNAVQGLRVALRDSATSVRVRAAAALGRRRGQKAAGTLIRALDTEEDGEVQIAILAALGRLATPDSVQKLVKAAQPDGRFFKKKAVAFRLASIQALGEARTPAAMSALQELLQDKDKDIRGAVYWALMGQRKEAEPVSA